MRTNILLIIFILLVSIFPRVWELDKYPPTIVDEPANLRDISKMINTNSWYPANFEWDGSQATLAYIPTIALIKIFMINPLFLLRISSVLFSLFSLIPFFFLVKSYTNNIVAFATTLMFSFSFYFLQFSRVGWGAIYPVSIGLYLFWIIESINKKNNYLKIIIAGVITGIIFYLYRAGEIYIIGTFLLIGVKIFTSFESFLKKILKIVIFLSLFLLISYPWISKINSNPNFYFLRQKVVSIKNVNNPYHDLTKTNDIILYQIKTSIEAWIFMLNINEMNNENPRYLPINHTIINPFLIPFFILGIIFAFIQFKKMYAWIVIYILGIVFGQILTVDPPNGARGLILLPVIYIFCALFLNYIYSKFSNKNLISIVLIVFSVIISYIDFIFYQYWMTWIKV